MRGWTLTIILLICAIVVIALFQFLFKNQMDKRRDELQAQNKALEDKLDAIAVMETEIPHLRAEIPAWRAKVQLYQAAIPVTLDDDVFFSNLAEEIKKTGVDLISVETALGGPWLGNLKEEEIARLEGIGVDVEAARKLKVAFYSIKLNGNYGDVVRVLERLKGYRRMYSIDEVVGPSGTGGGTVLEVLDAQKTPIEVSGKIFYGIPSNYISDEQLALAMQAAFKPVADKIFNDVRGSAREVKSKAAAGGA